MWNLNDPYHMTLQDTQDEMREWMTAIDAAIQGVPDKAEQRMRSASLSYRKVCTENANMHICTHTDKHIHARKWCMYIGMQAINEYMIMIMGLKCILLHPKIEFILCLFELCMDIGMLCYIAYLCPYIVQIDREWILFLGVTVCI